MMNSSRKKGHCLCRAVSVQAATVSDKVGACHCGMCRRWSGGPWLALDCGTEVTFDGNEHITLFNSSAWAERGFCNQCGTHLFYRLKQSGQHFVPVGLFDELGELDFDHQIFIDEKPKFYEFANKTSTMTGAEVFAKYASKAES